MHIHIPKFIVVPMARAAIAAGADSIMVEVHSNPSYAMSDKSQRMSLLEFDNFYSEILYNS